MVRITVELRLATWHEVITALSSVVSYLSFKHRHQSDRKLVRIPVVGQDGKSPQGVITVSLED